MLRLLKEMRKKEVLMTLICVIFILGQIYFDLKLPDYMSNLTIMIKSAEGGMSGIWQTGARMLGCTLASAALCIVCGYLSSSIAAGFSYAVREKLFGHIMDLGAQQMQELSVPSLITRTTNDITQIQMIMSMGLQTIVKAPVMAVWAVIKILGKSWELSVVTAGFAAALIIISITIIAIVMPRFRIVQRLTDKINKTARENLTGINVVHAFNAEDCQNAKFEETNAEMMRTQLFNQRMFALMQPTMNLGMNGLTLCIYWVGALLLSTIALSEAAARLTMFGNIVVFSTYAMYVVMSFVMMIMVFMMFPAAQVSASRINEVLRRKSTIKEGSAEQGREEGTIEFKNVSFSYPGSTGEQLTDISFKLNKGETIAFIGSTGSGKTTLLNLIARFYDASKGEVLVDGVNVKDYSFDTLYNIIGFATQKPVLFSGTIEENIVFGESEQSPKQADIEKAAEIAQAKEFIEKSDGGYKHRIAQSGKNISGGQKQRLSIARVLARKPEIMIFDDSFSALDYRTDAMLRSALAKELKGTSCVIVAQRISTIRNADKIVVLDKGEAAGIGTHEELMKGCEVYREIAKSQLSEDELERAV